MIKPLIILLLLLLLLIVGFVLYKIVTSILSSLNKGSPCIYKDATDCHCDLSLSKEECVKRSGVYNENVKGCPASFHCGHVCIYKDVSVCKCDPNMTENECIEKKGDYNPNSNTCPLTFTC